MWVYGSFCRRYVYVKTSFVFVLFILEMDAAEDQIVLSSPPPDDMQALLDEIDKLVSGNDMPESKSFDEGMLSSSNVWSFDSALCVFSHTSLLECCHYCGMKLSSDQWKSHEERIFDLMRCSGCIKSTIAQIPFNTIRYSNGKPTCKECGNILSVSPLASDNNIMNWPTRIRKTKYPYVRPSNHLDCFRDTLLIYQAKKKYGLLRESKHLRYSIRKWFNMR